MKRILLSSFPRRRESRGIPPFLKGGLGGILLLLFLSSSSFAARIPLAVYGLTPQQGVTPGMADMVSDMVRMKLRACGRFDLIEKAKMEEILKEHAFQQTGCTETECAVKMGKVLNVKKMVVGGLGKMGTAFRLSLRVVDVETALIEVEDAESQTVKEEEMEGKLVPPLVARLCPLIKAGGTTIAPPSGGGVEVPAGSLTVNSTPSGATVFLDGEPKGLTPQGITDIPAGEHQIVLTLEGYKDYQEAVTVTKGTKKLVSAVLKMQIGGLRIFTTPSGASVSVDGVPRGVTTEGGLLVSGLKAGEHTVRASKTRYEPYEISAFVEPDGVKDVKVDLSARPSSVVVTSTPSGAAVYLDGASKGVTPCSVTDLAPGAHSVSLKKDGYEDHSGSVILTAGTSGRYSAVLKKTLPSPLVGEGRVRGQEIVNEKDGSTMILILAGEFTMGSNEHVEEKPIHTVYLNAYYIDKYEVTVGQFKKFVEATSYVTDAEKSGGAHVWTGSMWEQKSDASWRNPYFSQSDNHPVVCVSWNDAKTYASWAGKRLPTEAEWEKAARGTDGRKYPWGNNWDASKCNNGESNSPDGYATTAPVGSFPQGASPYGAMDMAGNVWEWCQDWSHDNYYQNSPSRNPSGPSSGSFRVLRGGGWYGFQLDCRASGREAYRPEYRYVSYGFRGVR